MAYDRVNKKYLDSSSQGGYSSSNPIVEYGVPTDDYVKHDYTMRTSDEKDYLQTANAYYTVDSDGYRKAQMDWMRGNSAFTGWSDADMSSFLDSVYANKWNSKQANAAQLWQNYQIGIRNSNEQRAADRANMLAEIDAYKAGYSNEHIAQAVSLERQALDQKIAETLNTAVNQAASQGRVMDNTTYAMLRGRLEAQAANVLQSVQMQYEQKRQEYALAALNARMDVYKNSQDTLMTPTEVTNIISAMAGK